MFFWTALVALLVGVAAPTPTAAARTAPLTLQPIAFKLRDGSTLQAEQGRFEVPEDRRDPRSRRIGIGFVRFRSTSPHPGAPIVYLAGGPGGSGVGAANGERQPIFLALRAVADVIAYDQRGVGLSNAVPPCTAAHRLDPALTLSEATLTAYRRETLDRCVAQWRRAGVAVGGYTTEQGAADLEDLRRALGARKLNLWGISYGSHLALATMRRFPGSIDRVALSSVEGLDQTVKAPAHVDAALGRIEAAAAPGLTAVMRRVHARFAAEPQVFTAATPQGSVSFRVDAFPLQMMAGILAKNPDGIRQLAGAYASLDAGRTQALAPLFYAFFYKDPLSMTGMPELMDIASGVSGPKLGAVQRQAATALVGEATNFPLPQLRGAVPGLDLGDGFRRELRSGAPTLILSGDLDVRAPLDEQNEAVAGLSRRHQIVIRNGGHDLFEAHPDIPGILTRFFAGERIDVRELVLPKPA